MSQDILKRTDAQVASIRKLSRAASAMVEAMAEGVGVTKDAIKRSGKAAEELMDETKQSVKRHPIGTIATTLALGLVAGVLIGWIVSRK